uniref:Uncharacterized protein n=1 Tax=Meloidogyne enterolobii TaxID=390850 RepID=A0A6V7WTA2_MELEN|nr:unnamed protein product [Meloidogyne enterolobii]
MNVVVLERNLRFKLKNVDLVVKRSVMMANLMLMRILNVSFWKSSHSVVCPHLLGKL